MNSKATLIKNEVIKGYDIVKEFTECDHKTGELYSAILVKTKLGNEYVVAQNLLQEWL